MREAVAISDDATKNQLGGVVGHNEFQIEACSKRKLAGQKQTHAAAADIRRLPAKTAALAIEKYRYIDRNDHGLALPSAVVLAAGGAPLPVKLCFAQFHGREGALSPSRVLDNSSSGKTT